jgi:hypothetical protein
VMQPSQRRVMATASATSSRLDADATGQATFHGCFDKIGREEGERDGHIDLLAKSASDLVKRSTL